MGAGPVSAPPPWGKRVEIATADGELLEALYSAPAEGRAAAIFFHGNADSVVNYSFFAHTLSERGMGLLAISYRGYGGSTGSPSETGLITDGTAALDWLTARHDGPVILVGQSLGSAVAVAVAAERLTAGIVLISAPDSILALAQSHYPYLPVAPLMRDPFRSDRKIAGVDAPKLFLHGDRDTIVPLRHGRALFELAPDPKDLRVLDGYGHNDLWSHKLAAMVADFMETVAKAADGN